MPTVVESIEASFKALIAHKPYRSVTVKEICEGAFISRRTFYANFVDKRAIIAYMLRRDAIDPVSRALELLSPDEMREIAPVVLERFYQGVFENREFYGSLVRPMVGNDPTFELVVARGVNGALKKLVMKYKPQMSESDKQVLYYHAAGWSVFLEKWIYDGCIDPPDELGVLHAGILVPSLEGLIGDIAE